MVSISLFHLSEPLHLAAGLGSIGPRPSITNP